MSRHAATDDTVWSWCESANGIRANPEVSLMPVSGEESERSLLTRYRHETDFWI